MTFDPDKPALTRHGRKARFLARISSSDAYPLVFLIEHEPGCESVETYTEDGKLFSDGKSSVMDLVNQ